MTGFYNHDTPPIIPSDPVEADLFKVDNMLNGVMFTSAVSKLGVREISFAFGWFPPALRSLVKRKQRSRPCREVGA